MIQLYENSIPDAVKRFDDREKASEDALKALFSGFKENTNEAEVLVKVITLNQLYSTRLLSVGNNNSKTIDVYSMAKHIAKEDMLDVWLHSRTDYLNAFEYIAKSSNGYNRCDSFASKYCSWHNQEIYPIMDKYARGTLFFLAKSSNNSFWAGKKITKKEMYVYRIFRDMVLEFQNYIKIQYGVKYTIKKIDKFLWLTGKENSDLAF